MNLISRCLFLMINLFCVTIDGKTSSITYDERQTGDYNVRISVKDLRIVALLGDGLGALGDYDYNYDYSDLTVKPIKPTGSTPSISPTTESTTTKKEEISLNADSTTEKIVEITPAQLIYFKPNITAFQKPNSTNLNQKPDNNPNITSLKPNTTINFPLASTIGDSLIAVLQSPTIQTPINNVLANFSSLFTELVESGSLGFKNMSNQTSNAKPIGENIPVQVLVTPVEVHYHNDASSSTPKPENSTVKRVRHGDCMEGYRKDKRGVCRPFVRRPTQPSLLKKLLQLSRRLQNKKQTTTKTEIDEQIE